MWRSAYLRNLVISAGAVLLTGAHAPPEAMRFVAERPSLTPDAEARIAVDVFSPLVRPLSHPLALETAFRAYFAYRAVHPEDVRKPYLYFVDFGLPSTEARGYVFDMSSLTVVDGPFAVAHGRGSGDALYGIPTRFSNRVNSEATSLGLYVANELYDFRGNASGTKYSSVGLRLDGVSRDYNDNARARHVVAHGAPYVSATIAGLSEGCPAIEPVRAKRLLPMLANGGMVFLFAPDAVWMSSDPWAASMDGSPR
jgi:hypothetical protein